MPSRSTGDDSDSDSGRVSRRRFLETAAASGLAATLAGCSFQSPDDGGTATDTTADGDTTGGGGTGGTTGETPGGGTTTGSVGEDVSGTVQIAATSVEQNNVEAMTQALREGGMPEGVDVDILATSEISGDVQSQYRQWITAQRSDPDIFRMDVGWTIPFIQRGQLVNLSDTLSGETIDGINNDYFSAAVDTAKGTDGDLYGVPYQVGLPTIQYRKDLVQQAGYSPDQENWATTPMSWERFSQVVADAKQEAGTQYGYAWQGANYVGLSCCTFNELMTTWGGTYFGGLDNLFGPVGERPVTVTEEPVLRAIRMARSFINGPDAENAMSGYQQISPRETLQWTEQPSQAAFVNGNAVALRYWPSAIPPANEAFGDDLGVMPIPYGVQPGEAQYEGTGGTASALGGWHMTLNPNSDQTDAATAVLEAMTSQSFRQFQLETLNLLPPDTAALTQDQLSDIPVWGEYAPTLQIAGENAIPRPVTAIWPDQSPAIATRVNAALAGQQTPEAAMEELQATLESLEQSA